MSPNTQSKKIPRRPAQGKKKPWAWPWAILRRDQPPDKTRITPEQSSPVQKVSEPLPRLDAERDVAVNSRSGDGAPPVEPSDPAAVPLQPRPTTTGPHSATAVVYQTAASIGDMSSLQFAIQASDHLRDVADSLCADTSCVQFCASLKVILTGIIKWLRTLHDEESSESEAVELLEHLESLYRVITPPSRPTQVEEASTVLLVPKSRYPAIAQLLANAEAGTLAVRNLASDRKYQRQRRMTLDCLGFFLPQNSDEDETDISPSNADLRAASEDPPECGKEIASLYKALFTHCLCAESEKVVARIRLRNSAQDDAKVTFGVLFIAHPHQDGDDPGSETLWQDTHISVQRTVNFEVNMEGEHKEIRLQSDSPFCSYISAQDKTGPIHLNFSVTGQNLYYEKCLHPIRQWGFEPSISLGQLLEKVSKYANELTEKRKEVLSWLLAKAVWQYYSSPWMLHPWNKESVHFLFERRQIEEGHEVAGIFVNEPLLSVSIIPGPSAAENIKAGSQQEAGIKSSPKRSCLPFGGPLHTIPKILALGIMLVEIQLVSPIESLHGKDEWSHYCLKGKPNHNTNYNICKDLIAKGNFFANMDISDPLEALIRNCIQPNDVFMPPHVRDEEGIREALYLLVNRLEIYLSKRKPYSIKPLNLSGNVPSNHPPGATSSPLQSSLQPPTQANPGRHPRPGLAMAQMWDTRNDNTGSGNQFPGASFYGPTYIGNNLLGTGMATTATMQQ